MAHDKNKTGCEKQANNKWLRVKGTFVRGTLKFAGKNAEESFTTCWRHIYGEKQ
jgi:hypothetical protein